MRKRILAALAAATAVIGCTTAPAATRPAHQASAAAFTDKAFAHPVLPAVAAVKRPARYTVKAGDTLTSIARQEYGHASRWPALWYGNRRHVRNPAMLRVGQQLELGWHPHNGWVRAWLTAKALASIPQPPPPRVHVTLAAASSAPATPQLDAAPAASAPAAAPAPAGHYSFGALEQLWTGAGGPAAVASTAAAIAMCESGGDPHAYNPSGASGLWQILGQVVPGDLFDPMVNALNAVAKFRASGDTFAQWVCQG